MYAYTYIYTYHGLLNDDICLCIEALELDVQTNALEFTNQKQRKGWKFLKMEVSSLWEPTLTCSWWVPWAHGTSWFSRVESLWYTSWVLRHGFVGIWESFWAQNCWPPWQHVNRLLPP